MISPTVVVLATAIVAGGLVTDCLGSSDLAVRFPATISNDASQTAYVHVSGADVQQSFALKQGEKREVTSYAGGNLTLIAQPFEGSAAQALQTQRTDLLAQLAQGSLSAADVQRINAQLAGLNAQLDQMTGAGSLVNHTGGACLTALQGDSTAVFTIADDPKISGKLVVGCSP